MVETIQQETGAGAGSGNSTGTKVLYYGYQDHLGSLTALVRERINGNGTIGRIVADYRSYDAWGRLRENDDWTLPRTTDLQITDRGYTGHEHLQSFGIINMNGRVYDPLTAQFFSPDPYVQAPDSWLNYNRYAYCLNNPLIYTDPDGEWIELAIAAILFFTDVGYDIQKAVFPIAFHVDLSFGSHNNGIGLDISIGIPQLEPISYRYEVGATYYFNRVGGYGSGWQVRNGAEWGLVYGWVQYGGMRYRDWNSDGLQSDQTVHTAQVGTLFYNASYSNDTEDSFPWARYIPFIPPLREGPISDYGSDRYRTASGRLRAGLFELGFFLHTGEWESIKYSDKTWHFDEGNINDPDRSSGIIYLGWGPFRIGWDSEEIRHTLQNRLAHDGLSRRPQYGDRYPWALKLDRKSRLVLQFGLF